MGKTVEIMGKTYKTKKLKKKVIEKLIAAQKAEERKKQDRKLKKIRKKERQKADDSMATLIESMSEALAPLETETSSEKETTS